MELSRAKWGLTELSRAKQGLVGLSRTKQGRGGIRWKDFGRKGKREREREKEGDILPLSIISLALRYSSHPYITDQAPPTFSGKFCQVATTILALPQSTA